MMKKFTLKDFEEKYCMREPESLGTYQYFSVLVPLVEKDDELHVLFEVRADSLKRQPGEICFPGGQMEEGENALTCAVRETCEELNIKEEQIRVIGELDYLQTYSNFTLFSMLGVIDYAVVEQATVSADEVKEIFLVPVSFFLENEPELYQFSVIPDVGEDFPYEKINMKNGYNWRKGKTTVPIYRFNDYVIWGMTARLVYHMLCQMRDCKEKK